MDELTGPSVKVVLGIKEGRGFDKITHPTTLVATLNGYSLETNTTDAEPNPQYATDLVWELDKNILRKMRTSQVPLKIECFTSMEQGVKEKIGYALLTLRSAQIISNKADVEIKQNWHKLLGLKSDIKNPKPEILLSLIIKNQESHPQELNIELRDSPSYQSILQPSFENQVAVPCILDEERLIQLGPLSTCSNLFLLNITASFAANLEVLLPEIFDIIKEEKVTFWFTILENDVHLKPIKKNSGKIWIINEKVTVRIRSSIQVLKNYLQYKPYFLIFLRYKDTVLGHSSINLQPLVNSENSYLLSETNLNKFTTLEKRCFLNPKNSELNKFGENKPYLDLQFKLISKGLLPSTVTPNLNLQTPINFDNYMLNANKDKTLEEYYSAKVNDTRASEIASHRNPAGDFQSHFRSTRNFIDERSESELFFSATNDVMTCPFNDQDQSWSVDSYHCFCLNIHLNSIKLSSPDFRWNIEFRFHHPKAKIVSTLRPKISMTPDQRVKLHGIGCRLHFISAVDKIKYLLLSFPPKISLHNVDSSEQICLSQCILDVGQLFLQEKNNCEYDAVLLDKDQNKMGDLNINLNLQDHGPYYKMRSRMTRENFGPPILDDSLAYKIVDELETWKEHQKEMFRFELKQKENRHLNLLSEEWELRKHSLESKLANSVEQCKLLADNLNKATEDLKARRLKSAEMESKLIKANDEIKWRYETKLKELKDSYSSKQESLTTKINNLEEKRISLETHIKTLTIENEKLQSRLKKQAEELEATCRGCNDEQVESLLCKINDLEEKLNSAQRSKIFFKEQWFKAIGEVHQITMSHQQSLEDQIRNSKEEIKHVNLEELLRTDSTALMNDQLLLDQLQKEINTIYQRNI